MYVGMCIYV
jgi:hypothetical protein